MSRRFTESTFRKYELVIAEAVRRFPEVVIIDPARENIGQDTMATRLRDSMRAFGGSGWATEHIDETQFLSLWASDKIVVGEINDGEYKGKVAIGGKAEVAALRPKAQKVEAEPVQGHGVPALTIDGSDYELVMAAACLLSRKIIPGPIVVSNFKHGEIENIEHVYKNVAVIRNGPDLTLI